MVGKEDLESFTNEALSRARFLKLAGLGAGLSLLPGSLVSPNVAAAQAAGGPEILNDGRYPIVAWWPPPPVPNTGTRESQQEATDARYAELAGAGFNTAIGGNGVSSVRASRLALDASENNGLRFVVADEQLRQSIDGTATAGAARSEAQEEPRGVLQALAEEESSGKVQARAAGSQDAVRQRMAELRTELGDHPALAGIALYDEPGTSLFGTLRYAKSQVAEQFGPDELPYVNVWPSYASPRYAFEAENYLDYLERYLNEARFSRPAVVPPVLSFDHYPLLSDERTTGDFFYNHAVIRRFALRFGVPSWAFIQSMGFDGQRLGLGLRRRPDEAEIFWQINVALAYGVKGIQYFTYWTPEDNAVRFGDALITRQGARTDLYDYATRANDFLRKVGGELVGLNSSGVYHANEPNPPRGAESFRGNVYVKGTSGDPAILGFFTDPGGPDSTVRYMLVTNRSPNRAANTRLTFTGAVTTVERFDTTGQEGVFVAETLGGTPPRFLNVPLAAGRARLYRLRTA